MFCKPEKRQRKIGVMPDVMPDAKNAGVIFAFVSIIPICPFSNIPHPYGMLI